jgi:hypothetical protein
MPVIERRCGLRPRSTLLAALLVLASIGMGCSVGDRTSTPNLEEVDPSKYELKFLRCSVETDEEYAESQSEPSIGGDTSRSVIAEYRVTNLDGVRRRFQVRATRTDSSAQDIRFIAKNTDRLDPGESSVDQLNMPVTDGDVAPYSCSAELWDSVIDVAFPDD